MLCVLILLAAFSACVDQGSLGMGCSAQVREPFPLMINHMTTNETVPDINECVERASACGPSEVCVNTDGSFICRGQCTPPLRPLAL